MEASLKHAKVSNLFHLFWNKARAYVLKPEYKL